MIYMYSFDVGIACVYFLLFAATTHMTAVGNDLLDIQILQVHITHRRCSLPGLRSMVGALECSGVRVKANCIVDNLVGR